MDKENASAATGSQVSVVSFSSLSAFNVPTALARLNELHTSQDCNDFCEMLEELIFKSCNNNESALGLEELKIINNVSWLCIKGARKTNTLLVKEHQEAIKAMVAKQPPTPSRSSSEIDVSNEFTTPVKCKRTSKSPNKGKAKKAKPSEEVIALSNSFSAIAHLEVDVKDLNEDNVVDTAPGTEEEDSIPQAPVEDPCNIDMIDNEQESPDESPLAVDAGGHTSSSTKDTQPKKRTPPIVIDEQYNTPGLLLEISEVVGKSYGQDRRRKA
ncbi:hypothetical protein TNCV_3866041 [Trichonephila clavipes]|nr:hypothetical protein TNCV_1938081 [Trichonephila clavipes]GFX68906.1 hypothetical protein TNCV_3866041 [Trichonephila clavipes]